MNGNESKASAYRQKLLAIAEEFAQLLRQDDLDTKTRALVQKKCRQIACQLQELAEIEDELAGVMENESLNATEKRNEVEALECKRMTTLDFWPMLLRVDEEHFLSDEEEKTS